MPGERSEVFLKNDFHFECGFRMIAGSVAHIQRRCSCFGGHDWHLDPPGMTRRQAARAALEAWKKVNPDYADTTTKERRNDSGTLGTVC